MWRSPALGHILIQISFNLPTERFLLFFVAVGRELDFNKKESILMVNHEQVRRLWMGLANEFRGLDAETKNRLVGVLDISAGAVLLAKLAAKADVPHYLPTLNDAARSPKERVTAALMLGSVGGGDPAVVAGLLAGCVAREPDQVVRGRERPIVGQRDAEARHGRHARAPTTASTSGGSAARSAPPRRASAIVS
jgi:hypothetical protein